MFDFNKYVQENRVEVRGYGYNIRQIVCKNGLAMSVQASQHHYCSPREDQGPYQMVEVGFPNRKVEALMEYAENPATPTSTVYGFVPVEVINKIVDDNGGLAE